MSVSPWAAAELAATSMRSRVWSIATVVAAAAAAVSNRMMTIMTALIIQIPTGEVGLSRKCLPRHPPHLSTLAA